MAIYVISDIHGYQNRFFDVLQKAEFDWNNDELYVLGDIIDRGPHSQEMLEWAMEETPKNIHFLLGNHEDMAYRGLSIVRDYGDISNYIYDDPWSWNGGYKTLDDCREARGSDWCHKVARWIQKLPIYYTLEINDKKFLLIHAGLAKDIRMCDDYIEHGRNDQVEIPGIGKVWSQHLLWIRERWFYNKEDYPYDYIIFGHSPTTYEWWDGLDTNWFHEDNFIPIEVKGKSGNIVRLSGYTNGHMRYCIDTGRRRMGLLRLDDMKEFYSDCDG